MPTNKQKNIYRPLKLKYEIILYYESLPKIGAKVETVRHFKLPTISTLNSILKNKEKIFEVVESGLASKNRKTLKTGVKNDIDQKVYNWILLMRSKKITLSADDIILKRNDLEKLENVNSKESTRSWFRRFQNRFNIKRINYHGEANDVNIKSVKEWKDKLNEIIKNYDKKDIFNIDETGLFYQQQRSIKINFLTFLENSYVTNDEFNYKGNKMSKKRLTIAFCVSMIGEKLDPLIIGRYKKPRCFKNIKKLPLLYEANQKSWMTQKIFSKYLNLLNRNFQLKNRKILLFLDNASCHFIPELSNIKLVYFPKNSTSLLQPLDQGIIHSFKSFYKKSMINKFIINVSENIEIKLPDILDSMILIKKSWNQVTTKTIINCFKTSGFEYKDLNTEFTILDEEINQINLYDNKEIINEINEMINEENENILQSDSDEIEINVSSDEDNEHDEKDKTSIISSKKAISHLNELNNYFKNNNSNKYEEINSLIEEVYFLMFQEIKQKKITDYFI